MKLAYLILVLYLTGCGGHWVPHEESCPPDPIPPLQVDSVLDAPGSLLAVTMLDASTRDTLAGGRIILIASDGHAIPAIVRQSQRLVFEVAGRVIVRSELIGYNDRSDTLDLAAGKRVVITVPMFPRAVDRCGLPSVRRLRWWESW